MHITYSLLRELPRAEKAEYKRVTNKTIRAPVQRLVLIITAEEQEGNVYGPTPSNTKEKKGPGVPVYSTKVPETTLKDALVTCELLLSLVLTDKDLETNNLKDSLTKTCIYADLRSVGLVDPERSMGT